MKRNGLVLSMVSLGHTGVHFYHMAFTIILVMIKDEFNLTFSQAGLILSVVTTVGFIVNIPSGALADVLGRKRLQMGIALLAPSVGYFIVSFAPTYGFVLLTIGLVGFGGALWHPPAMSTLSDRFPGRRGFALSWHEFGANLGDFLGPGVTGVILAALLWRQVLGMYVVPGIVLALLVWLLVPDIRHERKQVMLFQEYRRGLAGLFSNPRLLQVSGLSALRTMGQSALSFFLPLYLFSTLGLGPAITGIYTSMLTFPAMFAGPVMGTLSDRWGRKPVLVAGMGAAAVLSTLLGFFRPSVEVSNFSSSGLGGTMLAIGAAFGGADFFLISLILLGLFLFSMRPIIFAYAMDVTPKELGATTVGFVFSTNQVLSALSPFIAGIIADVLGPRYAFLFVGTLIIGGCIMAALLPKPLPPEDSLWAAR